MYATPSASSRKLRAFTAIIVLTLALSIGACTAIYSALDSIVLHPYDDPATERNVILRSVKLSERVDRGFILTGFRRSGKAGDVVRVRGALQLRQTVSTPRYFDPSDQRKCRSWIQIFPRNT
jgi:hypothetical protein